jgi:hypothetical protein
MEPKAGGSPDFLVELSAARRTKEQDGCLKVAATTEKERRERRKSWPYT